MMVVHLDWLVHPIKGLLETSPLKEGADAAGREQTTGRKETQKQKKTLQAQTSKGGKGDTPLGCSGQTALRREQCGMLPESLII
jgi:hypothetical protein